MTEPSGRRILPVIDRLFAPKVPAGSNALVESIRREIEWLLESESLQSRVSLPPRVVKSVRNFGVRGWSALIGTRINLRDSSVRERLQAAVAEAISAFEPRLEAVTVRVPEDEANLGAEVRVEIRAMLKARHGGEPVAFETMIRSERSRLLSVRRAVDRAQ